MQSRPVLHRLNHLLALVHPALYKSLELCQAAVHQSSRDEDRYVCELWESLFHGIAIISNGSTRAHRDTKGHLPWYDMLVSIGSVDSLTLNVPELNLKLRYDPRTVVVIAGHVLSHSVERWEAGERACWAFFLRKNILDRFDVACPGWCREDQFRTSV